jgi:uncharacterized protein (TIGR00251 family)
MMARARRDAGEKRDPGEKRDAGQRAAEEKRARLTVRLQPRAAKNEITGWQEGALRVRLTAPPVEGAANKALMDFLAEALGIRWADVELVAGEKSRTKTVEISGLDETELAARLPSP